MAELAGRAVFATEVIGEELRVSPSAAVTPAFAAFVRANKPAIVAALTSSPVPPRRITTIAEVKRLMNRIAESENLPMPFDGAGYPTLSPRAHEGVRRMTPARTKNDTPKPPYISEEYEEVRR